MLAISLPEENGTNLCSMIKLKGLYDEEQDFINRKHHSRFGGGVVQYMYDHGIGRVPYFEIQLRYKTDENYFIKEIIYFLDDEGCYGSLDYKAMDDKFRQCFCDYFTAHGYPLDGEKIDTEERIMQFVNALRADGFDVDRYFEDVQI